MTLELAAYRIGSCLLVEAPRTQAQWEGLEAVKCGWVYYCMYSLGERLREERRWEAGGS